MDPAPLSSELLDAVMNHLREHHGGIMTGGSRCHTVYGHDAELGWFCEEFDEGHIERRAVSEHWVRSFIEGQPASARGLLYGAARASGKEALLRGDEPAVLASIEAACVFQAITADDELLRAVLLGPGPFCDETHLAKLRAELEGFTLWHVFMNSTGWERTHENGQRALRFLDRVLVLIGSPRPVYTDKLLAAFAELAGDVPTTVAALQRTLLIPPRYEGEHNGVQAKIDKLLASS